MSFPNLPLPEAFEGIQFLHVVISIVIGGFILLIAMWMLFEDVPLAEVGKRSRKAIVYDFQVLLAGISAFVLGIYLVPVVAIYIGALYLHDEGPSFIRNLVHLAKQLPHGVLAILRGIVSPIYILYRGVRLAFRKEQES